MNTIQTQTGFGSSRWRDPVTVAAVAGLVGPLLFYTVMTVLGAITPGYDAISRFGSDLSLGPWGAVMIAGFVACGLLVIAFAYGLRRVIGPARSGRLGAAMVGLAGACLVVAGLFVTDPNGTLTTVHGAFHVAAALVLFFVAAPVGGVAIARRFRRQRGFALYSALSGLASPPLFIATWFAGDLLGLVERILIAVIFLWLTILALRLYRRWAPQGSRRHTAAA